MERGVERRNKCLEFVREVYEMVDDRSTDSIISWGPNGDTFIVWKPRECCRDLLPQYLGAKDFGSFEYGYYGLKRVEESRQLEYAGDDFVKDQPELLEKIGKRYEERLNEARVKRSEPLRNRMKNCKTQEEIDLVLKEDLKDIEVSIRARMDKQLSEQVQAFLRVVAMERECRRGEAFPKPVEDRVQLVLDSLNDLTSSTHLF